MSIIATLFVYIAYRNFGGLVVSFLVFIMMCSSTWIIFFARNLYWVTFLLFMPFIISWLCYPVCLKEYQKKALYGMIFLAILIKSLCGYEFITCAILSAIVPVIYYDSLNEQSLRRMLRNSLPIIISGIGGFLAAFAIHLYDLYLFTRDLPQAFGLIWSRAAARIYNDPYAISHIKGYSNKIFDSIHSYNGDLLSQLLKVIDVRIEYEKLHVVTLPILQSGIPLYIVELIVAVLCFYEIKKYRSGKGSLRLYSLCIATMAAYLASNSWAIITANGHMKYHLHMNAIIFYLPFLLMAFILIAIKAVGLIERLYEASVES
jgi:hypothetical protein